MRKLIFFVFFTLGFTAQAQVRSYQGYYVTLEGDTVKGTVIYRTIMQLQDTLVFQTAGSIVQLLPKEIRGFGMHLGYDDFPYTDEKLLVDPNRFAYVTSLGLELNGHYGTRRTLRSGGNRVWLHFESAMLKKNDFLFLLRSDDPGMISRFTYFYTQYVSHTHRGMRRYTLSTAVLIGKSGMIIARKKRENERKWVSRVTSDYPILSAMVRGKKFSEFSVVDMKSVFLEYNRWYTSGKNSSGMSPSPIFAGVADADSLYSAKPIFLKTLAGTSLAVLPGLAVAGYYMEQPIKPVWPEKSIYNNDKSYQSAYLFRADSKKAKAIVRGWKFGFVVALGAILALSAKE